LTALSLESEILKMPNGQPFTRLCQQLARPAATGRADLHLHTTHSDGDYSPAEVVDLARRSGLSAIAITDHDTTCGVAAARTAAGNRVEVIAGVEVTAEHEGREVHLLGYFIRCDDPALCAALAGLRIHRRERFFGMVERLRGQGVSVDESAAVAAAAVPAPGRRTLATLLHTSGRVGSVREAFARWLADGRPADVPKARLPLGQAIALVRAAGGVGSLAHPSAALTLPRLTALKELGLQGIEADYPSHKSARAKELRQWALALGLAVTGGSDCHGPDGTAVGACGVTADELAAVRQLAN
jgi:predicted metal-dependent phosphoesterase TrpH